MKQFARSALITAALALSVATAAQAHTDLVSSQPESGAMVMQPVQSVTLEFGAPVKLVNVRLVSSSNKPVSLDFKPVMEPSASFSVPVPNLKPDTYTVNWMAMGDDGHKMKGSFGFMQH